MTTEAPGVVVLPYQHFDRETRNSRRISQRTTEESLQTSRRSAQVRRARLVLMYHYSLDDDDGISWWAPRFEVNTPQEADTRTVSTA